jgi:hypothetical protein
MALTDDQRAEIEGGNAFTNAYRSNRQASVEVLIDFQTRKNQLTSQLREVNERIAQLQEHVIEHFIEADVQSLKTKSGEVVFLHTQVWANPRDGDYGRACDALDELGFTDFVERRFNVNKVSSLIRELLREKGEEGVPQGLRDALLIREVVSARVRGAGKS